MITITLTWMYLKLVGLPLFVLSVIAFLGGSLPDHSRGDGWTRVCDTARWLVWPTMLMWLATFLIRSLWL